MSNQLFIGDLIVSTCADRLNNSDSWRVKGGFSKGLGHSRMVVGCDFDASASAASSMRDGDEIPFRQFFAEAKPYLKGSILKWLSANYEASCRLTKLTIGGETNGSLTMRQNLFAAIVPCDCLQFSAGAEHFQTRFPEGNTSNLVLLDVSAVWRLSGKLRMSLTADNLLDKRIVRFFCYLCV